MDGKRTPSATMQRPRIATTLPHMVGCGSINLILHTTPQAFSFKTHRVEIKAYYYYFYYSINCISHRVFNTFYTSFQIILSLHLSINSCPPCFTSRTILRNLAYTLHWERKTYAKSLCTANRASQVNSIELYRFGPVTHVVALHKQSGRAG